MSGRERAWPVSLAAVILFGCVLLLLLGPRLTATGSTNPTPPASLDPSANPASEPTESSPPSSESDCSVVNWQDNTMRFTVKNTASASSAVIVATFDGYGAAHWNTSDGQRPKVLTLQGSYRIYRPAALTLVHEVAGEVPPSGTNPLVDGGKVGCDEWTYSSAADFTEGTTYVVFLAYSIDSAGARSATPGVLQAWPVTPDGIVSTPQDGQLKLADLEVAIRDIPLSPWPSPGS